MNNMIRVVIIISGLFALLLFSFHLNTYAVDDLIFSPTEKPFNISYADLAKQFWKWQFSMAPDSSHPINDPTGANCTNGQSNSTSPVFYLSGMGGGEVVRKCDVPKEKGILIPVMTAIASPNEYEGFTFEQIQAVVRGDQDTLRTMELTIDDQVYTKEDLLSYRTMPTSAFDVDYLCCPTFFGAEEGPTSLASADGYYIVTKPLTPGQHVIHWKSGLGNSPGDCKVPGSDSCTFSQNIKYELTVR
jgi:hypothetical protein